MFLALSQAHWGSLYLGLPLTSHSLPTALGIWEFLGSAPALRVEGSPPWLSGALSQQPLLTEAEPQGYKNQPRDLFTSGAGGEDVSCTCTHIPNSPGSGILCEGLV